MRDPNERYLEISHLTKTYPAPSGGEAVIVRDFDLSIRKGEFVCLIGHSGCGKSTVLSIAAGLLEPTEGGVLVDGREIPGPGPDRGVVFQSPALLPWMTAFENVMLGVTAVKPDAPRKARAEIVTRFLERVGLADALHKKPAELSAGMRQRVGLARAFALDPKVLLLDEPFGMLDSLTRFELQEVLIDTWAADERVDEARLRRAESAAGGVGDPPRVPITTKTALMVTHDVDEALFLSDRIALMTNGPAARLGGIVTVPFARPRDRTAIFEHPDYYPLRERLIGFLEEQTHAQAA
jgi:ABC-type nitrate/sulfonate/bicarbonate transport system ATPase subunit